MDGYEAVRSRRAVRGFLGKPVPGEVLTSAKLAEQNAGKGS
ncbi:MULTISPECIES: hypothetical protein [Amycolatopsis]|nr:MULTISPECIES: hypothetical protein [Amycolatopsis]